MTTKFNTLGLALLNATNNKDIMVIDKSLKSEMPNHYRKTSVNKLVKQSLSKNGTDWSCPNE